MQTYRCQHCGQVLAAFVSIAPGLALPFSTRAAETQVQARREQHAERCPANRARAHRTAVVIGASMAGLLAARVLSETYDHVRVLDRDELPEGIRPRGGVPQGTHTHGLLARGRAVLEELFPGLADELVAAGAIHGDMQRDMRWIVGGGELRRAESDQVPRQPTHALLRDARTGASLRSRRSKMGTASTSLLGLAMHPAGRRSRRPTSADEALEGIALSRPLLEHHVRRRVEALPRVSIATGRPVTGLEFRRGRVRGVTVGTGDRERRVLADLVVDASGRTSKLPKWLADAEYAVPETEEVRVGVAYTTRTFARTPTDLDGDVGLVVAATPDAPVGAAMLRQEGDRWIVSLGGYHGDVAPRELPGFVEFGGAVNPALGEALASATPLDDGAYFRFPASVRHRYDHLRSFPEGLLVTGDAACSFNPVFGQGMSVAALEALALRDCLRDTDSRRPLAERFFEATRPIIDGAWQISVSADLQLPGTPGRIPLPARVVNRYVARFQRAAHDDPELAAAFLRVMNLIESPASLMRPRYLARVLAARPAPDTKGAEELQREPVTANPQRTPDRPARAEAIQATERAS